MSCALTCTDLLGLQPEGGATARGLCEAEASVACAVDGTVFLHPDAPAPDSLAGRVLVAQGGAHGAQQAGGGGRGAVGAPNDLLGAEAHAAAAALLAGRPFL